MKELKRLVREGFGFILAELRQRRSTDTEILKRLDVLIKLAGGDNAKLQALREDHDAFSSQAAQRLGQHERRIRDLERPAVE